MKVHCRPLVHIALVEPQIPQNTGNVARMAAGFDVCLWIVGEPKFSITEKALVRAGLDYWPLVDLRQVGTIWDLIDSAGGGRLLPITTRGQTPLSQAIFKDGDILTFGNETIGLPPEIHRDFGAQSVRIDQWGEIRSLNLATAAGIVVFEALRQLRAKPDCTSPR